MSTSISLESVNDTLYGKKWILRCDKRILKWKDYPERQSHISLSERGRGIFYTRQKGKSNVAQEAETAVMQTLAKQCQQPPDDGRAKEPSPPWSFQRGCVSAHTLTLARWYWSLTSGLQNCEWTNFCCLRPPLFCSIHWKLVQP